jgi:hypothetical protein
MTSTATDLADGFLQQVHVATGIRIATMLGDSTDAPARAARYTCLALIFQLTEITVHDLGGIFRRDTGSVYYALKRVRTRLLGDPVYARQYTALIGQRPVIRQLPAPASTGGKQKLQQACERINGGGGFHVTTATHGALHQLNRRAADKKLRDAREQRAYWTMAKASATRAEDRNAAAARLLIWTAEVDACERRLRELTRTETLPA